VQGHCIHAPSAAKEKEVIRGIAESGEERSGDMTSGANEIAIVNEIAKVTSQKDQGKE
jgi:hypothetical protein